MATRRAFLKRASVGAATLGALPLATMASSLESETSETVGAGFPDSLIAHLRDASTGEVALFVGTREVIVRDRQLVARLLSAARRR